MANEAFGKIFESILQRVFVDWSLRNKEEAVSIIYVSVS
jgi:hypothetical protein